MYTDIPPVATALQNGAKFCNGRRPSWELFNGSHSFTINKLIDEVMKHWSEVDSLQVMLVINPAVGCQYFLPGPRLPPQLQSVIAVGRFQFILLGVLGEQCA